jgi:gluconate 2-dehydrogenase gamma chain
MGRHSRRTFLSAAAAAGVAWVAADRAELEAALAGARQAVAGGDATLTALTNAQAETVEALTARILPPVDGRPGARELGVVYFIDRALATFARGQRNLYARGINDLNRRAARLPGGRRFAALPPDDQDAVLRAIEKTPFFAAARLDTIVGAFALPSYGGNRDYAGWHLLGLAHQPVFQAPFGYYDADVNKRG